MVAAQYNMTACSVTAVAFGISPHIVVIGSCKVGNFVVSTPMLRGLRARFPDAVIGFIAAALLISSRPYWS